jgi:hypothetical protein
MKKQFLLAALIILVGLCGNVQASPVDLTTFIKDPSDANISVAGGTITITEDPAYGYVYLANDNFYVPQNSSSLTFNYSFTLNPGDSDYMVGIVNFTNYDFNLGNNNSAGLTQVNLNGIGLIDLSAYQNQIISLAFGLEYDNGIDQAYTSQAVFSNIEINSTPVPLPGAIWLFGSGLACIAGFIKRSKKS